MRVTKAGMVALMSFLFAFPAQAADREFADIYTDCGLGAIIAPHNAAVAAVTNVTWDLGTTAITSHASSEDACKGGKSKMAALIYETYPKLEKDLARGSGEHLEALLLIAGCDEKGQSDMTDGLRADLAALVARDGYSQQTRYEQAEQLFNAFTERISTDHAGTCHLS